ncbi:SGNH/GDSL hydrolase family protein [Methanobrevibacter sp.]|uniref:SGNH/GDSL hydrolase family protein n=1 Tax=Methanobrevibacter sp. TaxID=66852 RepID=UPI00388D0173
MTYQKQTFVDKTSTTEGTILKAEHLNNIQDELYKLSSVFSKIKGKKVSIIGDSISTFQGYLADSEYAYFYPKGNVTSVEQTWWYQVINELEMSLLKNCSWSGSECYGNSSSTTTASAGCSTKRINDLANGTTKPDIIFCYIGINDFYNGTGLPSTEWTPESSIPSDSTNIDNFFEAYVIMIHKIKQKYPNARVFCFTLMDCPTVKTGYPLINGAGVALNTFNDHIRKVANTFGCDVIELHNCGLNQINFSSFGTDTTHPNVNGHKMMKDKIKVELLAKY